MERGKFITLEGVDGSGKTIQAKKICEYLSSIGIPHTLLREPGGTEFGESIRNLVLSNTSISPITEVLLFFAARSELVRQLVLPNLERGVWVICDRFYDSTLVYQGVLGQADIEKIMQIKDITIGELEPDLTLVFDLPSQKAIKRVMDRNADINKYDLMTIEKYKKIIDGYRKIAELFSFRCVKIKAADKETVVFKQVMDALQKFFSFYLDKTN